MAFLARKGRTSAAERDGLSKEVQKIKATFDRVYDSEAYKARRRQWDADLALYKSQLWKPGENYKDESLSKVQANFIFSTIEQIAPLMTDNRPIWYNQARMPRFQRLAALYNKANEYLWDLRELDDLTFDTEKDNLLYGKGIVRVFWNDEDDPPDVDYELIDPRTFCGPEGYEKLWKMPWCGEKSRKPMSWIRANYPDDWTKVRPEGMDGKRAVGEMYSIELENLQVDFYRVWMRDDEMISEMVREAGEDGSEVEREKRTRKYPYGRILEFTPGVELRDEASPFHHGKPPYVDLDNYKVNHEFWSMGEPAQIRELYKEINVQIQAIARQGRTNENRNYTYDSEALADVDPDEIKDKFFEGGNMWARNPTRDTRPVIEAVDAGGIDRRHMDFIMLLWNIMRVMSQVTETAEGRPAKKERQSATEYGSMLESSYTRVRQKVRNLESFFRRLNWMTQCLQQQFYTDVRFVAFKTETDEGPVAEWAVISNRPSTAINLYKPEQEEGEGEEEYQQRLLGDEDYNWFAQQYANKTDPIHFAFRIEVQSSSSLPKDKQTLANLMIRLSGIQITPNSPIDAQSLLEILQIPHAKEIAKRKRAEREALVRAKAAAARQPQAAPTGGRGAGATGPRRVLTPAPLAEAEQPPESEVS